MKKEESKMTSVFLFCISERKVLLLLEMKSKEESSSTKPMLLSPNYVIFFHFLLVAMLGILYLPSRSIYHSVLYPRRLTSINCIKQALVMSDFRLGLRGHSRWAEGHQSQTKITINLFHSMLGSI